MSLCSLPQEIWTLILEHTADLRLYSSHASHTAQCFRPLDVFSLQDGARQRLNTLKSLSLVCRWFRHLAIDHFFHIILLTSATDARSWARLLAQDHNRSSSIRQLIILNNDLRDEHLFRSAVLSIVRHADRLEVLRYDSQGSGIVWRLFETSLLESIPNPLKLTHFRSNIMGEYYLDYANVNLLNFLRKAKNLLSLQLNGFFMFPDYLGIDRYTNPQKHSSASPVLERLELAHVVSCNLKLLESWSISENLVCLKIGTLSSYLVDGYEATSFFKMKHQRLRCVHFGDDAHICPALAEDLLSCAPNLQLLDYPLLGNWSTDMWRDRDRGATSHGKVETLDISLSHATNELKSLFRLGISDTNERFNMVEAHLLLARSSFPALKTVRLRVKRTEALGCPDFEAWFLRFQRAISEGRPTPGFSLTMIQPE